MLFHSSNRNIFDFSVYACLAMELRVSDIKSKNTTKKIERDIERGVRSSEWKWMSKGDDEKKRRKGYYEKSN